MSNDEGGRYPRDPLGAVIGTNQPAEPSYPSPPREAAQPVPERPATEESHGLWAVVVTDQTTEGVERAHEIERAIAGRQAAFDVAVTAAYSFNPGVPQLESRRRVYGRESGYLVVCDGSFNSFPFRVHVVQELDLDD